MIQHITPREVCWGNKGQDTRLTAFALLLYFYRGGNISKNMYSELLNSTSATEAHLIIQTNTPYLSGTPRPIAQRSEKPVEDTSGLRLEGNSELQRHQAPCGMRRYCHVSVKGRDPL
ncbi:hypothetical protein AV530_008172 [Patagioenas fasciata monilis]|uniref:Uncharacterized protein n=1 Tax=Patagioenas fasciata monilis TaxID=372326 RepID=A0A1V4KW46_PATFA|nr:hypothetical protein AV530_008172 [Patagioenas fasciata monilis]